MIVYDFPRMKFFRLLLPVALLAFLFSCSAPTGGSPTKLDFKFAAVDGRDVDLAKLKGKVVLVDFWATWCPECVGEVPHVVETYKKFHHRGFEIVGISLDEDKDALTTFTKSHGMDWPQYFDGKGWDSSIGTKYGIRSLPAMWLIDKEGNVAAKNAREDLAGQVEKLLAK